MEFQEAQAIYQQVADYVIEMVLRGRWVEGERVPSVRELAVEFEVNPNTVNKGYAYLQDRGVIHNQRGIGYFVSEGAHQRTRNLKREEFVREDLPRLFKSMELVGMDLDELRDRYVRYRNGDGNNPADSSGNDTRNNSGNEKGETS